jgi:hypothetical protein
LPNWNPARPAVLITPMARSPSQDNPTHWRQLAQDARATAKQLDDPDAKRTMIEIAENYEQLASIAERKMASKSDK